MKNFIIVAIYILFSVSGLIFMKLGGDDLIINITRYRINLGMGWFSVVGILFYLVSFVLWITILPKFNLNYIVPVTIGIVQVLILFASVILFKENISFLKIFGVGITILGVVIMNL